MTTINKFLVAIATAVAALAVQLASVPDIDAITTAQWLAIGLTFAGALGVYVVPFAAGKPNA